MKEKVIVVLGPTATGKTSLAVNIARNYNAEIISADSRQVYKGLDIGTGKDISEYSGNDWNIPYHLIDIAEPNYNYNLKDFCIDTEQALCEIRKNGKNAVIAGGTALYLDAILNGYTLPGPPPDKDLRESLHKKTTEELQELCKKEVPDYFETQEKNNRTRIIREIEKKVCPNNQIEPINSKYNFLIVAPYFHRKIVHSRIEQRLDERFEEGMIEEVQNLHDNGVSWERLDYFGLEYRYIARYLQKQITREELKEQLFIKIRQFAKRQDIWFRKLERKGLDIYWVDKGNFADAQTIIDKFLNNESLPKPQIRINDIHYGPISSIGK